MPLYVDWTYVVLPSFSFIALSHLTVSVMKQIFLSTTHENENKANKSQPRRTDRQKKKKGKQKHYRQVFSSTGQLVLAFAATRLFTPRLGLMSPSVVNISSTAGANPTEKMCVCCHANRCWEPRSGVYFRGMIITVIRRMTSSIQTWWMAPHQFIFIKEWNSFLKLDEQPQY